MASEVVIHIVEEDAGARDSLRALARSAGFSVRTYESREELLQCRVPDRPGCLILDMPLRDYTALDVPDRLDVAGIGIPVIILTDHGDVPHTVRAIRRGALDVIEKPYEEDVLLEAVQQAVAISRRTREQRTRRSEISARLASLTPRERQVLDLVVVGWPNKRIAGELGITMKTVEAHRAHMMGKMRVGSLAELVRAVESTRDSNSGVPGYDRELDKMNSA